MIASRECMPAGVSGPPFNDLTLAIDPEKVKPAVIKQAPDRGVPVDNLVDCSGRCLNEHRESQWLVDPGGSVM